MEPKETCAICLRTLTASRRRVLFTAECSHTFHFLCIASIVHLGNHNCPTCHFAWTNLPSQSTPNHCYRTPALTLLSFADDEPLPSPSPAAPTSASSSTITTSPYTFPQNDVNMTVKAFPECPAGIKSDRNKNSYPILIAPPLLPEASDIPAARTPLDLIVVLDVSGSMNSDKIRLLKQTTEFTVNNLCPTDRLSVIKFANFAQRVTPLQRMTNIGRANTVTAVSPLQANGATNVFAGLQMAVRVLQQRRDRNPVSSIVLLSDGLDNKDGHVPDFLRCLHHLPPCLRANDITIKTSQTDFVPVHTFGFGADHDATVLRAIADGSGGTFSYVGSIEVIQDAFAQCIADY